MRETFLERIRRVIIQWLARRLPDCKTMTPIFGESLDRKTTIREKILMKLHMLTCDACERYLKQVKFIKKAMHEHGERVPGNDQFATARLSDRSKDRIKELLRADAGFAI